MCEFVHTLRASPRLCPWPDGGPPIPPEPRARERARRGCEGQHVRAVLAVYACVLFELIPFRGASKRGLECGVRAPVVCGTQREQTGEHCCVSAKTYRSPGLFLQTSPTVSGNLREITG